MKTANFKRIPEDLQIYVSRLNELIRSSPGGNSLPTNSIDEIIPGLYLGDRSAATDINLLSRLGITHVLNCAAPLPGAKAVVRKFLNVETGTEFYEPLGLEPSHYMEIYADDLPLFDLSQYFERTTRFIDEALSPQDPLSISPTETNKSPHSNASASTSDKSESEPPASALSPSLSPSPSRFQSPSPSSTSTSIQRTSRVLVHCREGISRSATVVLAYLLLRAREPSPSLEHALRLVRSRRSVCPNDGFLAQLVLLDRRLHPENVGDERNS